jgi:dTMP kinase
LDLKLVSSIIDVAVGSTRPDLTLLLVVPQQVSEERRLARQSTLPFMRDRMEEGDQAFFERVAMGYQALAKAEPQRICRLEATGDVLSIHRSVIQTLEPFLKRQ